MHAFLKLVAGLILMGSVGSLEIDRIGFTQYFVQCALGVALWIVAELLEARISLESLFMDKADRRELKNTLFNDYLGDDEYGSEK